MEDLPLEQRRAFNRAYRATGLVTLTDVSLPMAFEPRRLDVLFLRVGNTCEVYISERTKYSGLNATWREIFNSYPYPGGARLVLTVRGDWIIGLEKFFVLVAEPHDAVHDNRPAGPMSPDESAVLLGVHASDAPQTIKVAFRRKVMLVHPDRIANASAAERATARETTLRLIEAYKTLTGTETMVATS